MERTESAVVLLGHGSRLPGGNRGLFQVAAQVAAQLAGERVEVAFLQLAEPGLDEAVERCLAGGARRIAVVPFFLFPGAHLGEDVPRLMEELKERHPEVELCLAKALGGHPKLAAVAAERARDALVGAPTTRPPRSRTVAPPGPSPSSRKPPT
jgi:precorrin-8X/cobalt-precorrin-8 methylmutase